MCGIFAAIKEDRVTNALLAGLQKLSYRGYDSAGIAVVSNTGLQRRRAQGKLDQLAQVLEHRPLDGRIGIAHTRWATHGSPSKHNAHPHMTSQVAVAHNGIIENHQVLRDELSALQYRFESDTDSEVIPQLLTYCLNQGMGHEQAMFAVLDKLEGSFAIVAVFSQDPDTLYAARRNSPLVIGKASNGFYLASDVNALSSNVHQVCYLNDGDLASIQSDQLIIKDAKGDKLQRDMHPIDANSAAHDKAGYRHYMIKEIHEQPEVLKRTLQQFLLHENGRSRIASLPLPLQPLQQLSIVACGTSYYAGMIGQYWLEDFAGVSTKIDTASEYRYRNASVVGNEKCLFISQSGETADTLAAMRHAQSLHQTSLSIVNVANSSMANESDALLMTQAGPEIGVASTKAFTSQLAVLLTLAMQSARANRRIDAREQARLLMRLYGLPKLMLQVLRDDEPIKAVAAVLQHAEHILYLGRNTGYALAMEGALKLKETSYIHAEAYPAGELKHGPIALIDDNMPVVFIAPPGHVFTKTLSNLREVATRGAKIVLISDRAGVDAAGEYIEQAIVMPEVEPLFQPILYALPLQLLAYHVAVLKGTDVDQPRNLAKAVTVE